MRGARGMEEVKGRRGMKRSYSKEEAIFLSFNETISILFTYSRSN